MMERPSKIVLKLIGNMSVKATSSCRGTVCRKASIATVVQESRILDSCCDLRLLRGAIEAQLDHLQRLMRGGHWAANSSRSRPIQLGLDDSSSALGPVRRSQLLVLVFRTPCSVGWY